MIRPEAWAVLMRWRDVAIGVALFSLGLWWAFTSFDLLFYLSFPVILLGAVIIWIGLRRARFPAARGGAGVVDVDERQITYFSANAGGAVSIDALVRVEVRSLGRGHDGLTWIFHSDAAPPLLVPGNAANAESLFDALAALTRVDYAAATRAGEAREPGLHLIWQKQRGRLH